MLTDFCSSPTKEHWIAVKRILRYLKGTPNYGLTYSSNVDTDGPLIGYSDANWAGVVNDCKSTSGYFFIMSGAAVSWKSQKQTCVLDTTIELQYCPTRDMIADILTKGLTYDKFSRLSTLSGVKEQSDLK